MPLGSLSADASQVPATLHSRISAWLREQIASGAGRRTTGSSRSGRPRSS